MLSSVRALCLPYCLDLQPCGRYAVVNRNYKPLGFSCGGYVHYGEFPVLLNIRVTQRTASKLSVAECCDPRRIYLYDDGCIPTANSKTWLRYQARLLHLAKLRHYSDDEHHERAEAEIVRAGNLKEVKRFESMQAMVREHLAKRGLA